MKQPHPHRFPPIFTADLPVNAADRVAASNPQAHPDFTQPGIESLLHRRRHRSGAPARLHLAPPDEDSESETYPSIAAVALYSPSAPIPIPARPDPPSRPITPLTGRAVRGAVFPFARETFRPSPVGSSAHTSRSRSSGSSSKTVSPTPSHSPSMSPSSMSREPPYPGKQPSSPRSPEIPLSPLLPYTSHGRNSSRAGARLHIPTLSSLHPANFQFTNRPEVVGSQRTRSDHPGHQFSDSQHKLRQYQRDLIANATRPSRLTASNPAIDLPPPRLHPLGSPGPVTPLALEEQEDYLAAGAAAMASSYQPAGGNADSTVEEKWIRQEQERMHRGGRQSQRRSPTMSPAGGRG